MLCSAGTVFTEDDLDDEGDKEVGVARGAVRKEFADEETRLLCAETRLCLCEGSFAVVDDDEGKS